VTTVARAVSPASAPNLGRRLRLLLFALIGIFVYFLVLTVLVEGGAATAAQQVANALTLGAIYALVALGYTMVYGIIELINFAHGDVFMIGTFVSLFFLSSLPVPLDFLGLHISGPIHEPLVLVAVLIATLLVCMTVMGTINRTIERLAYRPLRHAPRVAPLITAIGVSLILQNIMQVLVGTGDRKVPEIFPNVTFQLFGANIRVISLVIFVVALVLMYGLQQFVTRTRLGRAMQRLVGVNIREAAQCMAPCGNHGRRIPRDETIPRPSAARHCRRRQWYSPSPSARWQSAQGNAVRRPSGRCRTGRSRRTAARRPQRRSCCG